MRLIDDVQDAVGAHMDAIRKRFKPGVKLTVMVRSPGFPDRDFVMTDDEIPELVLMLSRRAEEVGTNPNG